MTSIYSSAALKTHQRRMVDIDVVNASGWSEIQQMVGCYALFEVKLGAAFVNEGAASLRKLSSKLDAEVMGLPVFCAVLVPGGHAYQRDDGVFVLPITCMAP